MLLRGKHRAHSPASCLSIRLARDLFRLKFSTDMISGSEITVHLHLFIQNVMCTSCPRKSSPRLSVTKSSAPASWQSAHTSQKSTSGWQMFCMLIWNKWVIQLTPHSLLSWFLNTGYWKQQLPREHTILDKSSKWRTIRRYDERHRKSAPILLCLI